MNHGDELIFLVQDLSSPKNVASCNPAGQVQVEADVMAKVERPCDLVHDVFDSSCIDGDIDDTLQAFSCPVLARDHPVDFCLRYVGPVTDNVDDFCPDFGKSSVMIGS